MAQIMYAIRAPSRAMLDKILAVLDRTAEAAALAAHCTVKKHWVSKSRQGLANHAMARRTFSNLERVGAPRFEGAAIKAAQAIQKELGLTPMDKPFIDEIERLIDPEEAEKKIRAEIPSWQTHYTSDDYTDMTWYAPTVRLYIGRPALKAPTGFNYPDWVMNALGGMNETIDPMLNTAAKTIGLTLLDIIADGTFRHAARDEFEQRTGGGIGGTSWEASWCDYPAPIEHPWPRYHQTGRGFEWWIPETEADRALNRR
jgi:aminobenzoyl-glutamate utilization protein B